MIMFRFYQMSNVNWEVNDELKWRCKNIQRYLYTSRKRLVYIYIYDAPAHQVWRYSLIILRYLEDK